MINKRFYSVFILCISVTCFAGTIDSLPRSALSMTSAVAVKTDTVVKPVKLLHAEPLYIDLIRDLGAHKGEKEWNIGLGLTDRNRYDAYTALVEYEFAPVNRLGFEIEMPFTFYTPVQGHSSRDSIPGSKLNSLKLASQWSFLVSEKWQTTMALGYIHEFELPSFRDYKNNFGLEGHVFNPFLVVARRWGNKFHSLLYTGPAITKHRQVAAHVNWQVNTSMHYTIPGTRNFIGVEFNKEVKKQDFDMTIRPQLRVSVADNLLVGIVTGIPIKREAERFSTFIRLIYEPRHKHS
ncbi:phosphoribosylformylglycinamidine synthase [Flavisolibacter sp. BT320]|nr:phosphoribosylformylglycinamidine synthase [Flavisolibacter longurius]